MTASRSVRKGFEKSVEVWLIVLSLSEREREVGGSVVGTAQDRGTAAPSSNRFRKDRVMLTIQNYKNIDSEQVTARCCTRTGRSGLYNLRSIGEMARERRRSRAVPDRPDKKRRWCYGRAIVAQAGQPCVCFTARALISNLPRLLTCPVSPMFPSFNHFLQCFAGREPGFSCLDMDPLSNIQE